MHCPLSSLSSSSSLSSYYARIFVLVSSPSFHSPAFPVLTVCDFSLWSSSNGSSILWPSAALSRSPTVPWSHGWTLRSIYHLSRIFRTPTTTTVDELHAFADIVKNHPRLAALATSLVVAPNPAASHSSYIPFRQLPSRVLPNVRHLVLGNTSRWADYPSLPLVYCTITASKSFDGVIAMDLSCHFSSTSDIFRVVRSFKNVKDVRLIYPNRVPASWINRQPHILPGPRGNTSPFKLQSLGLSVSNSSSELSTAIRRASFPPP